MKALLLCVGGLVACAVTQPPPVPPRQSTISLEIRNATLANGLRVVLVRDPRAADVQVTMQYRVGSIHDPVGQEGMAHLVEHLMFQQVLGAQSLFARLEDATTTFNATTREEVTTYTARARPERLDELLSIEAVRVGYRCTSITESTFTREREVVLQELRQRGAFSEIYAAIYSGVFPEGHPYHRALSGSVDSVSKITLAQACSFADTHYTTTNAVLVVSGNVTPKRLDEGIGKFLGRVPKRETQGYPVAIPDSGLGRRATVEAPIDQEALLFTWPLPRDPGERLKMRTVARVVEAYIDDVIRGSTARLEVGDEQARTLCIVVIPRGPQGDIVETVTEKLASLDSLPDEAQASVTDQIIFGKMHQDALYSVFADYEDGSDRDDALAIGLHAGRDPDAALAAASATLRSLTFNDALRVLHRHLNTRRMSVVMMKPREGTKHGVPPKVEAPVHDIGQRRELADPEEAKRPETDATAVAALGAKRELALPNGLKIILLPVTSVPTVEIRLVLHTGTADDPVNRRGAAMVAAHGLQWPRGYLGDLVNFTSAGASRLVELTDDTTAFVARGLDMHLDFLLTGLARWIREGAYDGKTLRTLRGLAPGDDADFDDAWNAAVYGPTHPYTRGGLARHIDPALTMDDVLAYHVKHYTPANTTIVIAGKFDAGLAQKWIEYLFADWEGGGVKPGSQRAVLQPISLAADEDLAQTHVRIALPASGGRAAQLVLAQMLDEISGAIRHQLGASYGFDAVLVESRLASAYVFNGRIEAARTREALELVRARIAALREDPAAAASAFVGARRRALAQLRGFTGNAHELAVRVNRDIALGRPAMSDATTAMEVQQLTIDQMTSVIAELDLARGAIFMRGPAEHVDPAFAALGRTPRRIPKTRKPAHDTAASEDDEVDETFDVDDRPIPVGQRLSFGVNAGYAFASARQHGMTGFALGADIGYRIGRETVVGVHVGSAWSTGEYANERPFEPAHPLSAFGLQLDAFVQASGKGRFWGAALVGLGLVSITENEDTSRHASVTGGLQGGIDLLNDSHRRLGLYGRLDSDLFSDTSYYVFSVGVGYRR